MADGSRFAGSILRKSILIQVDLVPGNGYDRPFSAWLKARATSSEQNQVPLEQDHCRLSHHVPTAVDQQRHVA